MLFNTAEFALFFLAFFVLYYCITDNRDFKLWLLTAANLLFYASWDYRFVPILVATGIVDYYVAIAIEDSGDKTRRKRLITLSVVMNLAVLGFFKYVNFFLEATGDGLRLVHASFAFPTVKIFVPLGISFYTFQSISYTVDVYRKSFKAKRRLLEFIASLTFFPHLLAGPIVRSSFLLPQFEKLRVPKWEEMRHGLLLIAFGLAKKAIADLLGPLAEDTFTGGHVAAQSAVATWTGVLAFAGQIYGDFSGYTDMAMGLSILLGFTLPKNFDLPYLSPSPTEFWRRWHISLSNWFRDYCYMPLILRNRRVYRSLLITMTLCGLWHGPAWTFIFYGAYHGVLLAVDAALAKRFPKKTEPPRWWTAGKVVLTFYLVASGFVFFRADSMGAVLRVLRDMHWSHEASVFTYHTTAMLALSVLALVGCHAADYLLLRRPKLIERPLVAWPVTAALLVAAMLFGSADKSFIYFKF